MEGWRDGQGRKRGEGRRLLWSNQAGRDFEDRSERWENRKLIFFSEFKLMMLLLLRVCVQM